MILQAFVDDSYNKDGVFVLAGHIATAEAWKIFSKEWNELLSPYGILDKDGRKYFKMREMASSSERMKTVPAFYKIIENHVLCSIAFSYNIQDLKNAKNRIYVPNLNIDWGFLDNHYMFAFRGLMDMFHNNREVFRSIIPLEQPVDFYFDNQSEKSKILRSWDLYMRERPAEQRKFFGAAPRFEDDKDCLPLQAADLWAWWVRKWVIEGQPEKMEHCDFGKWKASKQYVKLHISCNEDQIVADITRMIRSMLEPDRIIYDVKYLGCRSLNSI